MSGIPYGQLADSVAEMKEVARRAEANYHSMEEWKTYAKRLEAALDEIAGEYQNVLDLYIDMCGDMNAQQTLKNEALKVIKKLSPTDRLLDFSYREILYDKVKADTIAEMKKNKIAP